MGFLSSLVPVLLEGAQRLADAAVDGMDLNGDQLAGLYNTRNVIKTHGAKIVEDTDNDYDDEALESLAKFAEDTLLEAGITAPLLPDFEAIAGVNNGGGDTEKG